MSVIDKLATSLNRRDEEPNKELATQIIAANDKKGIKELVEHLSDKNKDIQFDCIKTLYEIGEQQPQLIASYAEKFIDQLSSKHNRMVWGAMTALSAITTSAHKTIYPALSKIMAVAEGDSIIARDHAVKILINLGSMKEYRDDATALLLELLTNSPENQFPTYAEQMLPMLDKQDTARFTSILNDRSKGMTSETKKKRVDKLIKKITGK